MKILLLKLIYLFKKNDSPQYITGIYDPSLMVSKDYGFPLQRGKK